MDKQAVEELAKAIAFKPELQMLHLQETFCESMIDYYVALRDCEAALCLDPNHQETLELYKQTLKESAEGGFKGVQTHLCPPLVFS
ncbi:hypothetical protein HanXRQr2_Chr17g0831101 [Helianthus annuus]|uniref:Tetratricopeptide-like helical domain-containing protein n=1 Tax=Helianthus annuus TaxID=4232 RepID=A0A9K3DML2_HELAN|nr:hypothetical protein HanXRQr2_Chr17g0831101 [Helianthus annuus]